MQWDISIQPVDGSSSWDIVTKHGQVGGKIQTSQVTIQQGKNLGQSNETSPRQQAESEAHSKWTKQHSKGYSEQRGAVAMVNQPMLAHKFCDYVDKIDYTGAWVQPKLDGRRCIAAKLDGEVTLTSRGNKPIVTMGHIIVELNSLMSEGDVWDGELYSHDVTFQDNESFVKKYYPGDSERIQFHVYDVLKESLSFADRFFPVKEMLDNVMRDSIRGVASHQISTAEELWKLHNYYAKTIIEGARCYEGVMLRSGDCLYRAGRSSQLLKVKDFIDEEFVVVDVVPCERAPTHAMFVCLMTGTDTTFKATPEGPHSLRESYLRDRDSLIGKKLTVRYFELTTSEVPVPRFPIGVAIREDVE